MTKSARIQSFATVKQKIEFFNQLAKDQTATVSKVRAANVSNANQTLKTAQIAAPIAAKLVRQKAPKVQEAFSEPLPKVLASQSTVLAAANEPSSTQPKTPFLEIVKSCELVHEGRERSVYIAKDNTHGYKTESYCPVFRWQDYTPNWKSNGDLILNNIYSSEAFYGGRYSAFANVYYYETPGIRGMTQRVTAFSVIPGAEPLSPQDKIPMEYILHMRNNGFALGDIKPENFVKVKRPNGSYDLIPIDGKLATTHECSKAELKDYENAPRFIHGTSFIHGLPFENPCIGAALNDDGVMSVKDQLKFLNAYRSSWTDNNAFYNREITESAVIVSPELTINIF